MSKPKPGNKQIIKCRDDKTPVVLIDEEPDEDGGPRFKLDDGHSCSWLTREESIASDKLRSRIEPWLTSLFQSEHFSLLVGSGITHALHRMATGKALPGMSTATFSEFNDEITAEAKKSSNKANRKDGNIEDQLRVAIELLNGLKIIGPADTALNARANNLEADLKTILGNFANSILDGESGVITAEESKRENTLNYLVSFLMSFASRTGTRDRLQIFTTNYDRCLEMGAEVAGLHLLDRFVGSLAPIFRSSRLDIDMHYNPPGIRGEPRYLEGVARFTKLHGSIDWVDTGESIRRASIPFGVPAVKPYLDAPGLNGAAAMELMIYPNSAKDRETSAFPYVELFRDFAAAICRPNSTLVTYGFSFGDEHINRVIEDMLIIPSTHLVVISRDDPMGRIMRMYESMGRHAQITLLIGDHLGNFQALVDNYLPKPAIDRTTFRMAELLRARWSVTSPLASEDAKTKDGDDAPTK